MSSRRTSSNSQRQNHKTRRDLSPVGKSSKEKSSDSKRNRGEQERFRSETDLSKQDDTDKEKDKDRRHKEKSNVTKTSKSRNRSPRRSKDTYDRKFTSSQKRDTKLKNEPKDKKDKKNVDVAGKNSTSVFFKFHESFFLTHLTFGIVVCVDIDSHGNMSVSFLLLYYFFIYLLILLWIVLQGGTKRPWHLPLAQYHVLVWHDCCNEEN